MWGHYFLAFYRGMIRHRLYACLNVLGLAVGVAAFLLFSLLVQFETSFDRWLPNADDIYRLNGSYSFPGRPTETSGKVSPAILPVLKADYPQIAAGARIITNFYPLSVGPSVVKEQLSFVDPQLFDVLSLPLKSGDPRTALAQPNNIVISETIAKKYFHSDDAVGRTMTVYYHGEPMKYNVSAVLRDLPTNTHLNLQILAPLGAFILEDPATGATQWGAPSSYTYLRFRNASDAQAVKVSLGQFLQRRGHDDGLGAAFTHIFRLSMSPVPALHFADLKLGSTAKPGVDSRVVYGLGVMGALTLLIAILNYVNLATARSSLRAREIALRKIFGATRTNLVAQLMLEAVALAGVAVVIGLSLAELATPILNSLGGTNFSISYWGADSILPWITAMVIGVGVAAGVYPALVLSRYDPAVVLASSRSPGGGRMELRLRTALISAQFAVAIGFTICTLVIGSQARYLATADRGFQPDGLVLVDSFRDPELTQERQAAILTAMRQTEGVTSVTTSDEEPGLPTQSPVPTHRPGQTAPPIMLDQEVVGEDYLRTYDTELVAGRMLGPLHSLDDISKVGDGAEHQDDNIVINVHAAKALGFAVPTSAIGQRVLTDHGGHIIVGVLRDVQLGSPQRPEAGRIYSYSSEQRSGATVAVRYNGVLLGELMRRLQLVWRDLAPAIPFDANAAEEKLRDFYQQDEQRARMFSIGSALAIAIGCVGLFGLAAFNTARRFKEIGIRKTLGATTFDILKILILQILRPVLIANIVAWPVAFLAMQAWLSTFNQRIALGPWFFVGSSAMALVVATLTVVAQSWQLARSEPAVALRRE